MGSLRRPRSLLRPAALLALVALIALQGFAVAEHDAMSRATAVHASAAATTSGVQVDTTASLPTNVTYDEALVDTPLDPLVWSSHVTRRLTQIDSSRGVMQTEVNNANAGDLPRADGRTAQFGSNMLDINKDITSRAPNPGQAVVDGENARGIMCTTSVLEGLESTRGSASSVRVLNPAFCHPTL